MPALTMASVGTPQMPLDTNKDAVAAVHVENPTDTSQAQQRTSQEKNIVAIKADVKAGPSDSDTVTEDPAQVATSVDTQDGPLKELTFKDVATHNTVDDMWFIIDNEVFDVTSFQADHPGGGKIFKGVAGRDATKKFDKYHRRAILSQYKSKLRIGVIVAEKAAPAVRHGFLKKMGFSKS